MYGLFQTTFYFGYMALFSLALGIMCGQYFNVLFLLFLCQTRLSGGGVLVIGLSICPFIHPLPNLWTGILKMSALIWCKLAHVMGQGHGMNSGVTRDRFGGLDAIRLSSFSSFVASLLVDKLFVSVSVVLICRVMYVSLYRFWRLCEDRDLMIYCYGSNCSSVPLVDLHWRRLVHCNISGKKAKLQLVWQQ